MNRRRRTRGQGARTISISATNIHGLGATQLVRSLLPALMRAAPARIAEVWTPDDNRLSHDIAERAEATETVWKRYGRRLPNAASRALEVMANGSRIAGGHDLLVLGDLPYATRARQVVFVQTPFLLTGSRSASALTNLKSAFSRMLFRLNMRHVHRVVVQTEAMHDGILETYPALAGKVAVIGQPAPSWLLTSKEVPPRARTPGEALHLFFPASPYPHKNHVLLKDALAISEDVARLDLTITAEGPGSWQDSRVVRHGTLKPSAMIERYRLCDALVFPSLEESYGLPLVEAMFLGLPILAADRPYARALCGDTALYFDPKSAKSLAEAVSGLRAKLDGGWRPDWRTRLHAIPHGWDDVARRMLILFDS